MCLTTGVCISIGNTVRLEIVTRCSDHFTVSEALIDFFDGTTRMLQTALLSI